MQIGLAVAATATAERAQLISQWSRLEHCDAHAVDGRARLYSLQKCAKTLCVLVAKM